MSIVVDFFKLLIPPADPTSPKVTVWRWLIVLGILTSLGHIAMSKGVIPNVSGYALASDLMETQDKFAAELVVVKSQLESIQLNGLEQAIERNHTRFCRATASNNVQAKTFAQEALRKNLQQYLSITGNQYILFDCNE